MKKAQMETEVTNLIQALIKLEETANLEKDTAEFLANEAQKLVVQSKKEGLTFEEQDNICKKMDALHNRMILEQTSMLKNKVRLKELTEKFAYLKSLPIEE